MKIFIAVAFLIAIISCTNEYKKGEAAFEKGNFEEAKQHYRLIEIDNDNYSIAQKRLTEISLAEKKQVFDNALRLYDSGRYNEAKLHFYLLSETDELYQESRKIVVKIDSINEFRELAYQKKKKKWSSEIKKTAPKERGGSNEINEIRTLLSSLIEFKDKNDFHKNGFSVTYKIP